MISISLKIHPFTDIFKTNYISLLKYSHKMQIIKYKISKIEINLFLIDHKYFVIFANQVLKSKTVFFYYLFRKHIEKNLIPINDILMYEKYKSHEINFKTRIFFIFEIYYSNINII